jgi:hypothetical protein
MIDLGSLGSAADLPGGPLTVSTVAMAVADLQASMAMYHETLGWGPWKVYRQEPPGLTEMRYRGSPAEFSFLVAGTSIPGMPNFWLCQPLEGPSLYRDLVEEGIPGPHFMTVWRKTEAESTALNAWLRAAGASELMAARVPGSIEFAFYDTRDRLGIILETGSGRSADQRPVGTYP